MVTSSVLSTLQKASMWSSSPGFCSADAEVDISAFPKPCSAPLISDSAALQRRSERLDGMTFRCVDCLLIESKLMSLRLGWPACSAA